MLVTARVQRFTEGRLLHNYPLWKNPRFGGGFSLPIAGAPLGEIGRSRGSESAFG